MSFHYFLWAPVPKASLYFFPFGTKLKDLRPLIESKGRQRRARHKAMKCFALLFLFYGLYFMGLSSNKISAVEMDSSHASFLRLYLSLLPFCLPKLTPQRALIQLGNVGSFLRCPPPAITVFIFQVQVPIMHMPVCCCHFVGYCIDIYF